MRVTVNLSWHPSDDSDTAGYKLSWNGGRVTLVGKDLTSLQLSLRVKPKQVYPISILAFDLAGNESVPRVLTSVYVA